MLYNFGAGPSMLPVEVLAKIKADIPNWHGGISVMECSHRGEEFLEMVAKVEHNFRHILAIPDSHQVLFFQGGARAQFSMVPLNLLPPNGIANYVLTGFWSQIAFEDACQFGNMEIAATNAPDNFLTIPPESSWQINPKASYLHYTDNDSADGLEFHQPPQVDLPLVSDMTSNLLTKPVDFTRYAAIFASTQKNLGIAGLTVVIVDPQYLHKNNFPKPLLYDYHATMLQHSRINTPPVFAWYVTGLVLEWALAQGGILKLQEKNQRNARRLYKYIDATNFYINKVDPKCRSTINVIFRLQDPHLEPEFVFQAKERGLLQLQGHHAIGGIRVTLNNAMPESGVDALLDFMQDFANQFADR